MKNFLNFHRIYYHPSNSYIYLYGNMDMEEKLAFLDEHYLSHFDYLDVDSVIQEQKAFGACRDVTLEYPVAENEGKKRTIPIFLITWLWKCCMDSHPGDGI